MDKFDAAIAKVQRVSHELDITNADHIALWLATNKDNSPLAWLACRIIEAHEAELAAAKADALQNLALNAERSEELAQAKADAEMLAEALTTMVSCTMGGPVAGGDGNTVVIYPPTGIALREAMDALATYREKHNG